MTQEELGSLLDALLAEWENEVVEFKRGGKGFSTGDIGQYFFGTLERGQSCVLP